MTATDGTHGGDGWAAVVRRRTGLGRLLPLGEPADGAWISERAAVAVLREAAVGPAPAPVLGELRIRAAGPDPVPAPGVWPPGAWPPGPLRMAGTMSAFSGRPLPAAAGALRTALLASADRDLGLAVSGVDLRVTELLDAPPRRRPPAPVEVCPAEPEGAVGAAAAGTPGVATLTRVLGDAVHTAPGRVRMELATEPGHRVLDVVRAVREAVAGAVPGRPAVAVLVTAVAARGGCRGTPGAPRPDPAGPLRAPLRRSPARPGREFP
ncbi:hypothetical protein [Streptomyces sp. PTD5-9]|uniref:hypothetical protein n=1 Tax=Streptomyces sp. PTD5-9 TaxID=3120150 RepID=UPI003007FA2E